MAKTEKNFFTFVKGLNTEASPLTFPDETALDIENFELSVSGKLRRRRPLTAEDGGTTITLSDTPSPTDAFSKYIWHTVGGDPSLTLVVVQHGGTLYFYEDGDTLSTGVLAATIDITGYKTDDLITTVPCTFAEGRTKLFVANPYMESIFLEYDSGTLTPSIITPRIRNFDDAIDDIPIDHQPTATEMPTITDAHFFNLKSRGWKTEDINQYFSDKSAWPSKNMIWHQGYLRRAPSGSLSTSTISFADWEREWNSDKLELELFDNSSAARGSLLMDPYDTTTLVGSSATTSSVAITNWTAPNYTVSVWTVTITTASAHGIAVGDEFDIVNNQFTYSRGGGSIAATLNVSRATAIAGTAGSTLVFQLNTPCSLPFDHFVTQYYKLGYVNSYTVFNPDAYTTTSRPSAIAYYAGRIFLSGVAHPKLSDLVFFSQIATAEARYSNMFQDRDPTSPNISVLLPDDGGVIQVPGLGHCRAMVPFGNSLIVIGSTGIWEISGGNKYFAADNYGVRKITDVEAYSSIGVTKTDFGIIFTSPRGIYILTGDEQTGNLVAKSLTEDSIQTLWNSLSEDSKAIALAAFDDALKRVRILYHVEGTTNTYSYDRELIFDMRLGSWYRYRYPDIDLTGGQFIAGLVVKDSSDNSNENKKTKYFCLTNGSTDLTICDMNTDIELGWDDWTGDQLIPYIITGYDNLGDFSTKRQAPYIHVYMERSEAFSDGTGIFASGDLINEGGLTMQARWDWSDNAASGKWGTPQQVYRIRKPYLTPSSTTEYLNGEPVNVAKVKIRGIGRALNLLFTGEEDKDAVLLGWSILYRTSRNKESGTAHR